jgi:predicted transcriptional regulator
LKRRLGIEALRRGQTISDLVVEALRQFLARARKAQATLPGLDEPTAGQVQGEPEDARESERQPGRA